MRLGACAPSEEGGRVARAALRVLDFSLMVTRLWRHTHVRSTHVRPCAAPPQAEAEEGVCVALAAHSVLDSRGRRCACGGARMCGPALPPLQAEAEEGCCVARAALGVLDWL